MKKRKLTFSAFLATAIVCYVFWILITGQIVSIFQGQASAEVLIAGAIVCCLVGLFTGKFFIHSKAFFLLRKGRIFYLIGYVFVFLKLLIQANIDVAKRALSPKLPVNPGIVKIKTELRSEYALAMLANSITLTPGTISMDIVEQEEEGETNIYYYIHWINVASQDPDEAADMIKGTMEKWIRRIWE